MFAVYAVNRLCARAFETTPHTHTLTEPLAPNLQFPTPHVSTNGFIAGRFAWTELTRINPASVRGPNNAV